MFQRKILTAGLAFLLILGLCGCTDETAEPTAPATAQTQPQETEPPATEPMPEAYNALLTALTQAHPWEGETILAEYPELSNMYAQHSSLAEVGYALADLDGDGQEELLLKSMDSPFVYDVYTLGENAPVQMFRATEFCSYRLYKGGYVESQWSESAQVRGTDYYLVENGEVKLTDRIVMDVPHAHSLGLVENPETADTGLCYFRSATGNKEDYTNIPMQEALTLQQDFVNNNDHLLPAFTPLSSLAD